MIDADILSQAIVEAEQEEDVRDGYNSECSEQGAVSADLVLSIHQGSDVAVEWLPNDSVAKESDPYT